MEHQELTINYNGQEIHVSALMREEGDDIVYDCYAGNVLLGTVRPTLGDDPIVIWVSDGMPDELVLLIGEAIEQQDYER